MKLISFSVKNYRSISTAYKLPLSESTIIVGPNNEGKSNVLRGLGLALSLLTKVRNYRTSNYAYGSGMRSTSPVDRFDYDWQRDFPISLQQSTPNGQSEFTCEFELTPEELSEFKTKIKVNLSTALKAKIAIGSSTIPKYDFLLPGKGKASLNEKRNEITEFINNKLLVQYIPAIRTSDLAIRIVENLLQRELSTLEDTAEFKNIVRSITKLQQPILKQIAKGLKESISSFIPDVTDVSINSRDSVGRLISSSCRVFINDGIKTELKLKGDGVISLTAISLLQHFSKQRSLDKTLILLLEEPESHLHPKAIHNLKKSLNDISKTNQVILTTHSPIIIDRLDIHQNIIVENGTASPAKNLYQIRDSLGITMSDNLSSAYLVLLVEGEEDVIVLKPLLAQMSNKIKSAFENATLIIDHLGGATNVSYKTTLYKNNLCNVIAYLDNDDAGRKGASTALEKGILKNNEYVLATCRGMQNSELEDIFELESYKQLIINEYGVDLSIKIPSVRANNKQWSDRVKETFIISGKIWKDSLESEIKYKVSKQVAAIGLSAINQHKMASIDSLVNTIENVLQKHKS